ncbi:alpha/beta hydrolase [Bacteroidota bacterium]
MKKIILIIALLLLSSCAPKGDVNPFFIKAADGTKLSANYFPVEESDKGVVLVHMLDREKGDWDELIPKLTEKRFNVIAIDLRGHGDSDLDWKEFTEDDFRKMVIDVNAAMDYLEKKGVKRFGLVGASIGANLVLKQAIQKDVNSVVLLSPGTTYRGLDITETIKVYEGAVFIAASKTDTFSADSSLTLFESVKGEKQLHLFDDAGHGTDMFSDPTLEDMVAEWLWKTV